MFKVRIDEKVIDLDLKQRHFLYLVHEGFDVYIDSGTQTRITELPSELKIPGELERLVRYAIFQNDIELTPKSLPRIDTYGQKKKPALYHGKITICRSKELIPATGDQFITFNPVRRLQLEEFIHFLKVAQDRKV